MLSDPTLEVIRRELRRISPDIKISVEQIRAVLVNEVLKRDVVEGEKADDAKKIVIRAAGKALRASLAKEAKRESVGSTPVTPDIETPIPT